MFVLLQGLLACVHPTGDDSSPAADDTADEIEEPDPSAPADAAYPYGNCVRSGEGFWVDTDETDWSDRSTYDALGYWILYREDADADGDFEQGNATTRDDQEREITWDTDGDDHGDAPDGRTTYSYGDDGLVSTYTWDNRADGTVEILFALAYDASGRRTQLTRDEGLDGTFEIVWNTSWTTDGDVTTELQQEDVGVDGTVDGTERRTWGADGAELSAEYDDDGDGVVEAAYTYTYDDAGTLTSYIADIVRDDGTSYDYSAKERYDAWGRYSGRNIDYDIDGEDDFLVRDTYVCTP